MGNEWTADPSEVDDFVARWAGTGGAENANFQLFASELAGLLGAPKPDGAVPENARNDYVFERAVTHVRGRVSQARSKRRSSASKAAR